MANELTENQHPDSDANRQSAVELARAKLNRLYGGEPDAMAELKEVKAELKEHIVISRHQQFMMDLKSSGKSIVEIEAAWHKYYDDLEETGKKEVWQEFYDRTGSTRQTQPSKSPDQTSQTEVPQAHEKPIYPKGFVSEELAPLPIAPHLRPKPIVRARRRRGSHPRRFANAKTLTAAEEYHQLSARRQQRAKHNLQSLAFGLSTGLIVVLVFMFSFFNQKFIAPFIHPGTAYAAPIILDPTAVSPTAVPSIIIPKINVEIPLVLNLTSTAEDVVQKGLENGVIHYPSTVLPGQVGNSAYFGHSSNNIFSPGKYKFAFTLLDRLNNGDVFYITYDKKVFTYRVYDKQVVDPTNISVLNNVPDKIATATLITCDPPGTSLNRLVVWGEQITPDPSVNASPAANNVAEPKQIVGNGPSLWSRIWPF